jgi:hypothetical protein
MTGRHKKNVAAQKINRPEAAVARGCPPSVALLCVS